MSGGDRVRRRTSPDAFWRAVSETGFRVPAGLDLDGWLGTCGRLGQMGAAMLWALADCLVWGAARFGERYAQVEATLAPLGYSPETLRKLHFVGERLPGPRRLPGVSPYHAYEILSLPEPEQDRLLAHAAQQRLTRAELRELVKTAKGETVVAARRKCACCVDGCRVESCRCQQS